MIKRIEDWLLAVLQRRCGHPGNMVAADILDGCVDHLRVQYCRRCGSIKTDWSPHDPAHRFVVLDHFWRRPDPHLWRGVSVSGPLVSVHGRGLFARLIRWRKAGARPPAK